MKKSFLRHVPVCLSLLLITTNCFAAGPESAFVSFVMKHQDHLPELREVSAARPEVLGCSREQKKAVIALYKEFLASLQKIPAEIRSQPGIAAFTAILIADRSGTSDTAHSPHPDHVNPRYMAFALLTGTGIDYSSIGSRVHLDLLATSFKVNRSDIENGIREALVTPEDVILSSVIAMIDAECMQADTGQRERFMLAAVQPFMTFLSRGYSVREATERKVFTAFEFLFHGRGQESPALETYANAFKGYLKGKKMPVAQDITLNNRLKPYGFSMTIAVNRCTTYRLLDYAIPVNTAGVGDILVQRQISLSLSGTEKGTATVGGSDITLSYDYLTNDTRDIRTMLESDSLPVSYTDGADALWKEIRCDMAHDTANALYRTCVRNSFAGSTGPEITMKLIRQFSVHEVRHKWDETRFPERQWYNVDMEMAAHFSEILYSGTPAYCLIDLINRAQKFYMSTDHPQMHETLRPIIIEGWRIARQVPSSKNADVLIIRRVTSLYKKYRTLRGKALPDPAKFKREIIDGPLKTLPAPTWRE